MASPLRSSRPSGITSLWRLPRLCLALALLPHALVAQSPRLGVLLGAGHTGWTGPYAQAGRIGAALGAVAIEWSANPRIGVRVELGAGQRGADLGRSTLLELPTRLSFYRAHLAGIGRAYLSPRKSKPQFFAELGAAWWVRIGCDVDLIGGPGLLGGQTIGCDEWEPSGSSEARPLTPNRSGADLLAGLGGYLGRFSLTLRVEGGGRPMLETPAGSMRATALILAGEWVFHGRR